MNLKKAILLINLFITILVVWMLISIVYTFASTFVKPKTIQGPRASVQRDAAPADVSPKDLKDYQLIVSEDIFRTLKDTSGAAAVRKEGDAKETRLNLKLRGTAVGENGSSYAIIFDGSTGREDLYEKDDTIQSARIQEILSDRIILNINGQEEALLLPVEPDAAVKGGAARPTAKRYAPPKRVNRLPKATVRPPKTVTPPEEAEKSNI